MNMLRSMFGVCSSSADKMEVHDTIRRIFGNEMVMKEGTDRYSLRTKYLGHVRENLNKTLDAKLTVTKKSSAFKKNPMLSTETTDPADNRPGRLGSKVVVFDASTGTGRLILVGDERVSVQGLSSFATIRATTCVFSGKWMYEVQLGTKGIMQVGWCTASCQFSMDTGVGDTMNSYAYDGGRVKRWNVATSSYGESWQSGDVIGVCLDMDAGVLEYYRYPVEGFEPLQVSPHRECNRASLLFKCLEGLVDEYEDPKPPVQCSKMKELKITEVDSVSTEQVNVANTNSNYGGAQTSGPVIVDTQNAQLKRMSKKAFLMALTRLVVLELGTTLRYSYVVVSEFLPRIRGALGMKTRSMRIDISAQEFFNKMKAVKFENLGKKLLLQPQPKLCRMMDMLWTFLEEAAVCEILEHAFVRECLLFDSVSPDIKFTNQIEAVYVLCGLMQHRQTRHHLIKHVFFNKITFDNFLNIKCPDDSVIKGVLRKVWWQRPTAVQGETDPRIAEMTERGVITPDLKSDSKKPTENDLKTEKEYLEDCQAIADAVEPLEKLQLQFVLMLLDNNDGSKTLPSTRKLFLEKFRRYILDNCILDMRIFNISRTTPGISWHCHARLLSALLKIWEDNPLGQANLPPHLPPKTYYNGELDFYNVDRLGGVLPFLVRTLRQDLLRMLGEGNPFLQSFEPHHYRNHAGVEMGISDIAVGSPGLATLPQVISSLGRFMQTPIIPMPNRPGTEAPMDLKGKRSVVPGSGAVDHRTSFLRLVDGLLALYHGSAIKFAEKICELRDNQLDMADCLHDIELRIKMVTSELGTATSTGALKKLDASGKKKKELMETIVKELQRSKKVYEEKLELSALHMAWVRAAVWTGRRQNELSRLLAGILHSLRLAADPDYVRHMQVLSKEILPGKSSIIERDSYSSLMLEYTSSSDQSTPQSGQSSISTPSNNSQTPNTPTQFVPDFAESLFAFVPEYHVDAMLELCNTIRLYMHPTLPVQQVSDWDELVTSCAAFLCAEFADSRIILSSTRESLVQTLASFATQPATMRAIERVPQKYQLMMIEELLKPYQNRAWAQSNWVLVRFWHGSGFGFRHRQWPHLAAQYGDREPTVNNLGAKVDAGLMSQCFGPCPSEIIQKRIRDYLLAHPEKAALFLNSLLTQINWAFSEFITMLQEIDGIALDSNLEPRQIKMCATCFDLYHGLARALEMTMYLVPQIVTKPEASDKQNDLLLGRTCQLVLAVVSRVCVRGGGGAGFSRLVARRLPDTDRVHYYVALAPVAGCLIHLLDSKLPPAHLDKVTKALITEPLFSLAGLEFMTARGNDSIFSFYNYPEDVTAEELKALGNVVERLRGAKDVITKIPSPGSSSGQSDSLCTICYARPADTTFVPCGHHSCRPCVLQHMLNSKQCFFCKAEIESTRDIEVVAIS